MPTSCTWGAYLLNPGGVPDPRWLSTLSCSALLSWNRWRPSQCPVISHPCNFKFRAGLPRFLVPYLGVQWTSFDTYSTLLEQWPANLVLPSLILWVILGRLLYSSAFVICCFQWMLKTALDMRVQQPSSSFANLEVMVHASHPYSSTDSTIAANNRSSKDFGREDFQILLSSLHAYYAAALRCLMSFVVLAIQAPKYLKYTTCILLLGWCHHLCWCLSYSFGCSSWTLFSLRSSSIQLLPLICLNPLKQFLCLMDLFGQ